MHDIDAVGVRAGADRAGAMHELLVGRNRAAHAGQGLLVIFVGTADHGVNLKPRRGLDDAHHPVQVVDAGQLDQNLILAQAVLLDLRLAHAQRVHAVANGLNGLLDGLLLKSRHHHRLHGQREARIRAAAGHVVLARILGLQRGANVARLGRFRAFHADHVRLGRIGLVGLRKAKVGRLQVLLNAPHRVVGFGVNRFLDHHLQNQVNAAAQVQAKVNPLGHGLRQGLAAHARRHPEDAIDENHKDRNDQGNLVVEILLHRPVSLFHFSRPKLKRPKALPGW